MALAVKGAEIADRSTDIGIVDVAIDVVGTVGFRVQTAADGVGGAAQGRQITAIKQGHALLESQTLAVNGFLQDALDGSIQGSLLRVLSPIRRLEHSSGAIQPVPVDPDRSAKYSTDSGGRSQRPTPDAALRHKR